MILQENKGCNGIQFAWWKTQAMRQQSPPSSSWPDLPVPIPCSEGCTGLIHPHDGGQMLQLLIQAAAGCSVAKHQRGEVHALVPLIELLNGLLRCHDESIEDMSSGAIRQN